MIFIISFFILVPSCRSERKYVHRMYKWHSFFRLSLRYISRMGKKPTNLVDKISNLTLNRELHLDKFDGRLKSSIRKENE